MAVNENQAPTAIKVRPETVSRAVRLLSKNSRHRGWVIAMASAVYQVAEIEHIKPMASAAVPSDAADVRNKALTRRAVFGFTMFVANPR